MTSEIHDELCYITEDETIVVRHWLKNAVETDVFTILHSCKGGYDKRCFMRCDVT